MPWIEQLAQFGVPTVLLFILVFFGKKYLDTAQADHTKLAKEKMLLEIEIRRKESDSLINWIDLLVRKVSQWHSEHTKEHTEILKWIENTNEFLKDRYINVDNQIVSVNDKLKEIENCWEQIKTILTNK